MRDVFKKREKHIMCFDFSNHAGAQVPTPKMKKMELARLARLAPGNGISDAARDLENSRRGARMT